MKDPDKVRCDRITTNLELGLGEEVRLAADRIGISKPEFIKLVLQYEIDLIKSVNNIFDLRRRA